MQKLKLTLKKIWLYALLAGATLLGYFVFIKRQKIELPERPTKHVSGDKPAPLPPKPKDIDWAAKIAKDLEAVKKESAKLSRSELIAEANKKYNKRK